MLHARCIAKPLIECARPQSCAIVLLEQATVRCDDAIATMARNKSRDGLSTCWMATHSVLVQNISLAIKAMLFVAGLGTMRMVVFADVDASPIVMSNGLRLLRK